MENEETKTAFAEMVEDINDYYEGMAASNWTPQRYQPTAGYLAEVSEDELTELHDTVDEARGFWAHMVGAAGDGKTNSHTVKQVLEEFDFLAGQVIRFNEHMRMIHAEMQRRSK